MAEEGGFHHKTKVHVSPFRNVNKNTLRKQGPSVSVVQLHVITDVLVSWRYKMSQNQNQVSQNPTICKVCTVDLVLMHTGHSKGGPNCGGFF